MARKKTEQDKAEKYYLYSQDDRYGHDFQIFDSLDEVSEYIEQEYGEYSEFTLVKGSEVGISIETRSVTVKFKE